MVNDVNIISNNFDFHGYKDVKSQNNDKHWNIETMNFEPMNMITEHQILISKIRTREYPD